MKTIKHWRKIVIGAALVLALLNPSLALAVKQFQVDTGGTLTNNLYSYWQLESNSNDFYGTNNGTDADISYVSGKVNNAADFDGTNDSISTAEDPAWTKMCWMFWVNFDTLDTADREILTKTNNTVSTDADTEMDFGIFGSGTLIGMTVNNALVGSWVNVSGLLSTATWYHFAINIDETADTAEWFLNTVSKMSTSAATQTHNNLTNGWRFGERRDGFGDLDGKMDEIYFRNGGTCTTTEIADHYNGGNGQTMEDVAAAAACIRKIRVGGITRC